MNILDELKTDYERADALQSVLLARATGEDASDQDYRSLRSYFVQSQYAHLLPAWLKSKRSLGQFWPFIQTKYETYRERRAFIYEELSAFVEATEKMLRALLKSQWLNFSVLHLISRLQRVGISAPSGYGQIQKELLLRREHYLNRS